MDEINVEAIKLLRLPKLTQLGVIVRNIDSTINYYSKYFNIRPWYRVQITDREIIFKGKRIDVDVDVVFAYPGKLSLELIEVKRGEDNIYTEYLQKHGEGLHHLGFVVSNFDERIEALKRLGIDVIQSGVLKVNSGVVTRYAFLDTVGIGGIMIELMQTRVRGMSIGLTQFMMKIGCLTGNCEKIK